MSCAACPQLERALSIGGWMNEQELMWLAAQARHRQYIIEFGSLHGRSTRALADNGFAGSKIWAVDPWTGDYYDEAGSDIRVNTYVMPQFCENLKDHIETGRVIPVRNFSYNFSLGHHVDMVFIDGDHRYETVVRDIKKAYELLKPGGLISGHDYGHPLWPGVKQAVDELVGGPIGVWESIWSAIKF